jgi:hypothetical protein
MLRHHSGWRGECDCSPMGLAVLSVHPPPPTPHPHDSVCCTCPTLQVCPSPLYPVCSGCPRAVPITTTWKRLRGTSSMTARLSSCGTCSHDWAATGRWQELLGPGGIGNASCGGALLRLSCRVFGKVEVTGVSAPSIHTFLLGHDERRNDSDACTATLVLTGTGGPVIQTKTSLHFASLAASMALRAASTNRRSASSTAHTSAHAHA